MNFKSSVTRKYKDSINKADVWRTAVGASAMISFSTSRYSKIFFGIQYNNLGFTRERFGLKFMDTIHPDIGIVNDLSQTSSNDVEYRYRYQYLTFPFLISSKMRIKKMKVSALHFMMGASISALVKHDIKTQLIGFSAYGEKTFILKDKANEASLFNANLQFGFRLENPLYNKSTYVFVQPNLYLPILKANRSDERAQLYAFSIQFGFMFKADNDKAK